jgi:ureidoacrylate peracid hydrolase
VCVESTLRDAFSLDYWPIIVSDATKNVGSEFTQQATLSNVEAHFGWVATSEDILAALSAV